MPICIRIDKGYVIKDIIRHMICLKPMRKTIVYIMFLACLPVGCSDSATETPAGQSQPDLVIRFALLANPSHRIWVAADLLRNELEAASQGRIEVELYDSGVLGAERQVLETCYLGVIEMVQCTSAVVTTIDPVFSLLDMPYFFINEEHHQKVLDGPIGREWLDGLQKHRMQGLGFYSCGFRNMYTKDRKVQTPDDLNGLKIRVMESNVMIEAINRMGASATPLAASEVFQALKTGVVDGAENDPVTFVSDKYYEAGCNNYSLTRHFANQHVLVVNRDWFASVKKNHPDLYDIIVQAPPKVRAEYNRQWQQAVTSAFETMKSNEAGVTINEIEDVTPFLERMQPVYDKFFEKHPEVPVEWVSRVRNEAGL